MTDPGQPALLSRPAARGPVLAAGVLAVVLALLAARIALFTLDWRMQLDTPLLHYMAFMVDEQGAAPYRDIFVTSFPGAILFHLLVLNTVGHGDVAFAGLNFAWMIALSSLTVLILRQFGWRVAVGGASLSVLGYLAGGPTMILQRDFVLVLPIALAIWIHVQPRGSNALRLGFIAALFALAVSIKPHSGIGFPLLVLVEWLRARELEGRAPKLAPPAIAAVIGFVLPTAGYLGWVAASGGWPAFMEMTREYLPLHVSLSRTHKTLEGSEVWVHLIGNTIQFGKAPGWLIGATVGPLLALASGRLTSAQRRLLLLFVGLAVSYCVYVILAGQFWNYHWMPFRYFTTVLSAFCLGGFLAGHSDRAVPWHGVGALLLTFIVVMPIPGEAVAQWNGGGLPAPDQGRVDEIAEYLRENLEPGDTVQPFDWARGGVHAALEAQAHMATPYVSDYHFYHHVEHPLVVELRRRLMEDLEADPPRFLLDMVDRPMPSGAGTTREFPELVSFVLDRYEVGLSGEGWIVWRRRD